MGKTVVIEFSERERFSIYVHFSGNVATNSAKEQDEYSDLWDSFKLDDIEEMIDSARDAGKQNIIDTDFSKDTSSVELTKDEAGHFIAFCGRPMAGKLSRQIRPLRLRVAEARDKAGMKAVPAEG